AAAVRALTLDPENFQACYYYGLWLVEQGGKAGEGANYIRKSVELQPRFGEGLRTLGRILYGQDRWEDAARSYERALALDPADMQSLFLLSRAYRRMGEDAKAKGALDRLRTLKGQAPDQPR